MAESFENLDHISRHWEKDKVQKVLSRHSTGTRSTENKKKAKPQKKNTPAVLVGSQARP